MTSAPFLLFVFLMQQGGAVVSSDPARAVIDLQRSIRQNPDVESNYTDLANVLLRTQNFREAAVVLETARKKFPASGQAALSLAVAYYGLRRFPAAVASLVDAGRLAPDAEQPVAFLDRISEHWGERKDDIIALFRAYSKAHPGSALAHLALGRATADLNELRQAVKLNPRLAEAHLETGSILQSQRDYPSAILAFLRAAKLNPKDPVPHYRLSLIYARTGDSARAEAERAIHEKLSVDAKAELDQRQAATKHLQLSVRP